MKAYQLKISIKNSKPPIWRRCIIPAGITFSQLSYILDNVMGWSGYHLSQFEFYHLELELREDDGEQPFLSYAYDLMDSSKTCINEYMENQKWFTYIYDFGDYWQHRVTIEKVLDDYPYNYPQVVKFKGACPMEDCGGIDGYYETLDIIEDTSHEEHASRKEWADSMLYEDDYDIDKVNEELQESCAVTMEEGEERTKDEIYEDILAGNLGLIGDKRAQKKGDLLKSSRHRTDEMLKQIADMIIQRTIDNKTSKIVDKDEIIEAALQEAEREMQQYAHELANEIRRESGIDLEGDSEEIELEEVLEAYTKEDVKELAKEYGLRKISALNKKDLIQRVSDEMLRPESVASNFLILHDEEIEAFEKAVTFGNGYLPEANEAELFDRLVSMGYVGIRFNEKVDIPESVKKVYQKINREEFNQNRKYVSWLNDCFLVAAKLYGVFEPSVILKLLKRNKAVQFSEQSLLKYFSMIPLREQQFILLDDLFIHKDLLIKENYKNLLRCQQDKKYYIPTYHEIKDFAENGYFTTDKYMRKLIAFLEDRAVMTQEEAQSLGATIQQEIGFGEDMHDILGMLELEEIILSSEADYVRLVELIVELWNDTRMLLNRGHKPNELLKMNGKNAYSTGGKMPTIVAGSSNMASLLQQNKKEIEQMGFHLDLESNADSKFVYTMEDGKDGEIRRTEKKIYPNDPCPCGSNKKYKKCCGRK